MILVVDASVAAKWFVREANREEALRLIDHEQSLHAPDLIISELTNITWKKCRRGEITPAQATLMTETFAHYPPTLHPTRSLATAALDLALLLDHPAYDCFYLACAQQLGGTLVTADRRLRDVAAARTPAISVCALDEIGPLLSPR